MNSYLKRTWAEINLDALANNVEQIRKLTGSKKIMAVVKANAYGHDCKSVCNELYRLGIQHYAVSNIWEADYLREILPTAEILVFGYTDVGCFEDIADNNIIHTVGSVEYARQLSEYAISRGIRIRVHIKIDTGMTRVGIDSEEELNEILSLAGLQCEGAYTHFSVADSLDEANLRYTEAQQTKLLALAENHGLLIHSQNSGGILYHGSFGGDMVRAGIIMYGCMPNTAEAVPVDIVPVMTVHSTVCQVKRVKQSTDVSYGRTYTTASERALAVIPIGYADGLSRLLSGKGSVRIRGALAPICGRVCMDQIIVDVTDIEGVTAGDIADIYCADCKELSVDAIADSIGTIGYELLCNISPRVPRIIKKNGEIVDVIRYR